MCMRIACRLNLTYSTIHRELTNMDRILHQGCPDIMTTAYTLSSPHPTTIRPSRTTGEENTSPGSLTEPPTRDTKGDLVWKVHRM